MTKILFPLFIFISLSIHAQKTNYHIKSYLSEGKKAPNTHYIGEAWLERLIKTDQHLTYNITKAFFKANSTLDWHTHTSPQVIIVLEGKGYYQERGKEPTVIKTGDIIKCDQGIEHWHSSSKDTDVTYLAIYSGGTSWTEVLSQKDYNRVANILKRN